MKKVLRNRLTITLIGLAGMCMGTLAMAETMTTPMQFTDRVDLDGTWYIHGEAVTTTAAALNFQGMNLTSNKNGPFVCSNMTVNGTAAIAGNVTATRAFTAGGTITGGNIAAATNVSSVTATISGDSTIGGNLTLTGAQTNGSSLTVLGTTTVAEVDGTIAHFTGNGVIGGGLTITGAVSATTSIGATTSLSAGTSVGAGTTITASGLITGGNLSALTNATVAGSIIYSGISSTSNLQYQLYKKLYNINGTDTWVVVTAP